MKPVLIVVTGASKGYGREVCLSFAKAIRYGALLATGVTSYVMIRYDI
jgi:NAD(P)-dependent dehydrogenase (short-subunit alcohol dehydrogenase family)